mmetsp:Transcript_22874/g.32741  ORF Transcript_22874/g.32741 Transcript_22874/m.32741 type:complete len:655 (+) Transcript_22874:34-1998(+)
MLYRLLAGFLLAIRLASADISVIDGTTDFKPSTESEFDHEVTLKAGELAFHWNDPDGNTLDCRLVHKASSQDDVPSWLSVGFYDTYKNSDDVSPSSELVVGSEAVIGLSQGSKVNKYTITALESDGAKQLDHQTLKDTAMKSINHDDGSISTVLTFTKELEESNTEEVRLRASGVNVFLWGVAPSGDTGLNLDGQWGALKIDLSAVELAASSNSATAGEAETKTEIETPEAPEATAQSGDESGDEEKTSKANDLLHEEDDAATADDNTAPVLTGECSSDLDGFDKKIALTPLLSFHWNAGSNLKGALQYQGESWLGFGISSNGKMKGSTAVIGKPDDGTVGMFDLEDKAIEAIKETQNTLVSSSIKQEGGTTILELELPYSDGITKTGLSTFLFAIGAGNEFGYHEHRGSFRLDLSFCGDTEIKTHMGAFAAHGTIATLAWAIASPFAVTVAWFRTLVPSSWIYIHVFSNVISFFFTLIAVIVAISAMSVQTSGSHFSDPHHWVGLVLLVAVTFQVMNGFLRPPVEKRDPYATSHYDMNSSFLKLPKSPREVWYFSHRCTGIAMLAMGIYQIQSGLTLFADNYKVESVLPWFWGYVALFAFCLITLKFWIMFEEYKARRGMEAMHVDNTQSVTEGGVNSSHQDNELVPVQFDMS